MSTRRNCVVIGCNNSGYCRDGTCAKHCGMSRRFDDALFDALNHQAEIREIDMIISYLEINPIINGSRRLKTPYIVERNKLQLLLLKDVVALQKNTIEIEDDFPQILPPMPLPPDEI